jgi:hypothetical protein
VATWSRSRNFFNVAVMRDRLNAEAQAIMRHVVVADFRSDAAELTELLAEPEPLPKLAAVSVMTIYGRLVEEHQTNQRLRARLRTMLSV